MSFLGAQNSIALGVQGLIHIDTGVVGSADYLLAKSLRFRASASAYLNRTVSTTGNRQTFTFSFWCKLGALGTTRFLYGASIDPNNEFSIRFFTDNTLSVANYASAYNLQIATTQVFRDPSAWYHIVVAIDTTQATSTDRAKVYVNGSQITAFSLNTYPAQNYNTIVNYSSTPDNRIASLATNLPNYYDGELAEFNFVDGYPTGVTFGTWATTNVSTIFGATGANSQWLPKAYTGTYGTNGFYLPFTNTASTSTLVADSSGNGNNWTPNNISLTAGSTYDSLTDVPTLTSETVANYAVLNPLNVKGNSTVSNGNLTEVITTATGAGRGTTIALTSGKFYVEATAVGGGTMATLVGVTSPSASTYALYTAGVGYYSNDGSKYISGVNSAYGTAWVSAGTYTIGMALDVGAGTIQFYLNNVAQGSITLPTMPSDGWIFTANWGSSSGSVTYNWNYGQQPFTYTAPSGFLPLNTFNIAAGTVTTSGTFTGNLSTDGPMVFLNGTPTAMTINGNAVTFGTQADKLANGFKVRSSSASYNASGSNTYVATTVGAVFKYEDAQSNP